MSNYFLYSGGPYLQTNGNAITSHSVNVNGGSAKNMSENGDLANSSWLKGQRQNAYSDNAEVFPVSYKINETGIVSDMLILTNKTFLLMSSSENNVAIGDYIVINAANIYYGIVQLVSTQLIKLSHIYDVNDVEIITSSPEWSGMKTDVTGYPATVSVQSKTMLNSQEPDNRIIKNNKIYLNGVYSNVMNENIDVDVVHNTQYIRVENQASQIRAGNLNPYNNSISGVSSGSNIYIRDDETTVGSNYNLGGEFAFKFGRRVTKSRY